jgi:hypothetical protein
MSNLFKKLWSDDCGGVLASEFLFLYTMMVVGSVSGLTAMRQALVSEMAESANSLMALNQSFSYSGVHLAGIASTAGSSATDQSNTVTLGSAAVMSPSMISQVPCE